jgi:hypothetical protein
MGSFSIDTNNAISDIPILALPHVTCMSGQQIQMVIDHIKQGGGAIILGPTAEPDEFARPWK